MDSVTKKTYREAMLKSVGKAVVGLVEAGMTRKEACETIRHCTYVLEPHEAEGVQADPRLPTVEREPELRDPRGEARVSESDTVRVQTAQ